MAQNSAIGNHEHYSVGFGFTDEHYIEFETMGDDSFTPVERIRIDGNEDKIRGYARLIDEESGGTDRYLKVFRGNEKLDNRNIVEYRNRQSGRRADDVDGEQPGGGVSGEDNTESPRNQPESIESGERLKVAENANDYETEPLKLY